MGMCMGILKGGCSLLLPFRLGIFQVLCLHPLSWDILYNPTRQVLLV
jgi:hypothetical protein